jgi:ribosomal protein S18 acetylase RimI-like enzyme
MSELVIAKAEGDDREWCAQLMASMEPWITLRRNVETARARFADPALELFVPREDGRPLGFLLCHPHGAMGSPYIASLGLAPEARSRGVGRRLLEFAEQHYRGRRHLFLLVSSFNPRAKKLYERMGYRQVGEIPGYVIAEASEILMHKRLE